MECRSVFEANKSGLFRHFSLHSHCFDIILYRLQLFLPARRKGGVTPGVAAVTEPRVERMLSRTSSVRQNKRLKEHGHERSEPYAFQADALWHPRLLVSASVFRFSCIRHETTTFRVPHRDAAALRGRIHESSPAPTSQHGCLRTHAGDFCNRKHVPAACFSIK